MVKKRKFKRTEGWMPESLFVFAKPEKEHLSYHSASIGGIAKTLETEGFEVHGPYSEKYIKNTDIYNIYHKEKNLSLTLLASTGMYHGAYIRLIGSSKGQSLVSKLLQLKKINKGPRCCDNYWCAYNKIDK